MAMFSRARLVSVTCLMQIVGVNNLVSKHTCTERTCISVNDLYARVCVCVLPPSYCVPILSKRQKAHLDLVGWKVGLLHRALLVNSGLLVVLRATCLPLQSSLCVDVHMSSLSQSAQLSKYLKLCKLIIRLPPSIPPHPQASASAFTNRKRE